MQVFNLFFKIFKSQIGQVIMYTCIFAGIASMVAHQKIKDDTFSYEASAQKISIMDEDNSTLSKALYEDLAAKNELVKLDNYDSETIQDELYNRNTSNVIIIPNGFEDNIKSGTFNAGSEELVKVYNLPGTMMSSIVTSELNTYVKTLSTYIGSGMDIDTAISKTNTTVNTSVDVKVLTHTDASLDALRQYLQYVAYVFIAIAISCVSPIILVLNKSDNRARINCSALKPSRYNLGLFLSIAIVGLGLCALFTVLSLQTVGSVVFTGKGLLYILNMMIFMFISLALAFLVGNLTSTLNLISMIANIVGLGCSFLGGIFVPLDFLSDTVIKIAHFLPSYWYVVSGDSVLTLGTKTTALDVVSNMVIQASFGIVFVLIGLVVQKMKRQTR